MAGSTVAQPNVTFSLTSADQAVQNAEQKLLIVAPKISGGSAANGSWHQNIAGGDENGLFGQSSLLAQMIKAAKRVTDRVQVDAIAVAPGTTPRQVTVQVTASSVAAGTIYLTVGSERYRRYAVPVNANDTAATIIASAVALVNADPDCMYTASALTTPDRLQLEADNPGTIANDDPIEIEATINGLTLGALTEAQAGATDPSLTTTLDVINEERYQGIVWAYGADVDPLNTLLDARFNANNAVRDGVGFVARMDTHANHLGATYLTDASYNHRGLVYFAEEFQNDGANGYLGPAVAETPVIAATYFAMIRALRLTPDRSISRFVTTRAGLDQFGGPGLASLPYFNTPIPFLPTPKAGRGFTETEIEQLTVAGAAIIGQNAAGSAAIAGEVPTTYLTDAAGNPDVTWKFLNYVDTASQAREYFHNNCRARFAQSRLTQDAVVAGRDMANASVIKGFLVQLYNDLTGPVYTLCQGGPTAIAAFKDSIQITINMATGGVSILMDLPILTQLRTITATVQIDFDITG